MCASVCLFVCLHTYIHTYIYIYIYIMPANYSFQKDHCYLVTETAVRIKEILNTDICFLLKQLLIIHAYDFHYSSN